MKIFFKIITLTVIVLLTYSCSSDDDPTIPINTTEFFKYSLDGGNIFKEIEFYNSSAYYQIDQNTNSINDYFSFSIDVTSSGYENVTGAFYFPVGTFNTFISNPVSTAYNWGVPGYLTNLTTDSTFYFLDGTSPNLLTIDYASEITCTITEYPSNIGEYIAFEFSGTYTDVTTSATGTITGSARLKRTSDRP